MNLYPGSFSDDIFASVLHIELNTAKYEALSYTWGLPTQEHGTIYIRESNFPNDIGDLEWGVKQLHVRPTLLEALRYLRLPDVPRVLWIDAVCINQQNVRERSQEVPRMGEIYNRAQQVVVWLGPEDNGTTVALEMIKDLSAGVVMEWHRRLFTTLPGSEAETLRNHAEQSTFPLERWAALKGFITRPWFQRLWVRQEVRLATKVVVQCGPFQAEWEDIEKVALLLEQSDIKTHIKLQEILFCRSLFPYRGSDNLAYILHRSSLCGYSDPRDLVYANLTLSSAIRSLYIKPNYSLPVAFIYKDLVCKYLQHWGDLEVLRSCDLQTAYLPT